MIVKEIMKDESIHLRLNELAMEESYPEFKKEQGDRSLADEESDSRFKLEIEEKNAEDLDGHASQSRFDIKDDEDIILRLNELIMDSNSKFKAEQEDRHEDLNSHRSLADEECDGRFKPKIEEENAKDLHERVSYSRFDINEHEYIILRLKELTMDSNSNFKAEEYDQHEDLIAHRSPTDEECDDRLNPKIEEENAEDLDNDASDSSNDDLEESNRSDVGESKKLEEEMDRCDSGLGTLEVLEEMVVEYQDFIDYIIEMYKDGEKKKREECWRVLLQMTESLNKGYKRVNIEMEWLKKIETFETYFNKRPYITEIFSRIEEVNATFYTCIEDLSSLCVDKLNHCKAELGEWILRIKELRANIK